MVVPPADRETTQPGAVSSEKVETDAARSTGPAAASSNNKAATDHVSVNEFADIASEEASHAPENHQEQQQAAAVSRPTGGANKAPRAPLKAEGAPNGTTIPYDDSATWSGSVANNVGPLAGLPKAVYVPDAVGDNNISGENKTQHTANTTSGEDGPAEQEQSAGTTSCGNGSGSLSCAGEAPQPDRMAQAELDYQIKRRNQVHLIVGASILFSLIVLFFCCRRSRRT
ncbi:unnamed protein product [Amoebophrya sp. A120]|nr:unnamed protein product [Amoebophrya sp. A120]|eukprot:GSA120T00022893001.1